MDPHHKTYEDGVRDTRIDNLDKLFEMQKQRADGHSRRMRIMERVTYMLMGAIFLVQVLPALKALVSG